MKEKGVDLSLRFSRHIYRIMKSRKNIYMKKNKLKFLSWEDYFKVVVLCFGGK
jgi:hypothetical protein